jgi:hypothetical protein
MKNKMKLGNNYQEDVKKLARIMEEFGESISNLLILIKNIIFLSIFICKLFFFLYFSRNNNVVYRNKSD